jgi:CRISPR/Cas system-associated exonuclease Cas4 (RecB family)
LEGFSRQRLEVSTDAALRLEIAQEWILARPADSEILVISHSSEAATDLHLRVVDAAGAWFGIKRFTLNALASRLAQHALASLGVAPATNLTFAAVVARAIHLLQSENKLSYFAPVATKPGFPVALARTLEDLRMNEVDSESLTGLERGARDLSAIGSLVEQDLNESKLSDRAALFRAAIDSLTSSENAAYLELPLLMLDVAVRSRLENKLIQELAARSPDVLVTVPHGDERTISFLEQSLHCSRESNESSSAVNSLSFVKQHLFEESSPPLTPLDSSVRLENWPGEPRECVEIVRNIQVEAAQGVPFDQMAVLLNSPGEYRSHLEEAFARAEVPAYFVRGTTAPDPAGRAMLALLSCAADGLSAKRFAEYLSLGQVPAPDAVKDVNSRWEAPNDELLTSTDGAEDLPAETVIDDPTSVTPENSDVIDGALRAPVRWERLLVDSAVIGGKDRWRRRLEGLATELRLRIEELAPEEDARAESIRTQIRDLDSLRKYALPLIERLDQLPDRANWGEWLDHLRELAVNALRNPEGVMATLAELEPMRSVGSVDLYEVQLALEARLHDLRVDPPKRRYGRVFVGSVEAARGLVFRIVFIPGLAERIFPRKIVDDPILLDDQRKGTALMTRRDQLEVERLGLRTAVGCAQERVSFSYPRIDVQQSRPRVPSFYALEALRAAEGSLPGFEEIASRAESSTRTRLGWPAPEHPDAAIDEAEYDLALLGKLVEARNEAATGAASYLLTANIHLARALRSHVRRWLRRWTPNDGLVDPDDLARQSIARHQFSTRSFSATALQIYASCPYRFFLSAILRFDLRQEPTAIEVIDPLTRGSLFHETQFDVLTKLKSDGLLPLHKDSLGQAFDLVDGSLGRLAADYEDKLAPAIQRVWQDGINSIKADLREWLRRMADSDDGWIPEKFELSFGLSDRGPRESDPASVDEPVEISADLKLRGSIDMVEYHPSGKHRVTDHKTGKARAPKDTIVGGGKYLQPLLYGLASQKLLKQYVESGRLYYCTADGGYDERVVPLDKDNLHTLNSVLIAIRQGLADAFLPAAPEEGACARCDFLAVCGSLEEIRIRQKPADRLVQLKGIRDLP